MGREALPPATVPPNTKTTSAATTTALAPGFRFHPTDEELVSYYLKRKAINKPFHFNAIGEVDIYKNEPWDLAAYSRLKSRDQEWYFFSALDKKYGNGARMNRATEKGYWKATGKDRVIRRNTQLVGMKKTLVFHSGRAPDGKRTNWVMHEYRIVEDTQDKFQVGQDTYVLCRVFHKNNIGPPSGNRYAPFIEEEWDDGNATFPGEDAGDDPAAGDDAYVERETMNFKKNSETMNKDPLLQISESKNKDPLNINELPTDAQSDLPACKHERRDDSHSPRCVLNTQAPLPLPLLQYKRRRQNDLGYNQSNASENSTGTGQDPSSSTTTTEDTNMTMTTSATNTAISALLEFSLMEPIEHKENTPVFGDTFQGDHYDSSVLPPSYVKLIKDLKKQVHKVTVEKETLKLEMMSAQAMINILQSRIDSLSKENEDLKRKTRDG